MIIIIGINHEKNHIGQPQNHRIVTYVLSFHDLKAALQYIDGIFWLYRTSLLFLILLFTHTVIMSPLLIIIIKNLTVIPTQKCVKNLVIFEMCITLLKIS